MEIVLGVISIALFWLWYKLELKQMKRITDEVNNESKKLGN